MLLIVKYLQTYLFGVGTLSGCVGTLPKEGGIAVLAGLVPSSQTVKSLLKTPDLQSRQE